MVNSSTYHRERITELEQQLAETKQRSEDDRKALREQVSLKEEAILRQVALPCLVIDPFSATCHRAASLPLRKGSLNFSLWICA
jgi:hypothetical protein